LEENVAKRTTHRSKSGTKLYAVRDRKGRFVDIQTYKRAHGSDIRSRKKSNDIFEALNISSSDIDAARRAIEDVIGS
jgi:hypothetical protein